MKDHESIYTSTFFDEQTLSSSSAAGAVLGILFKYFLPSSVIDVGCGRGVWLAAAESLGSRYVRGLDGSWVRPHELLSKSIVFTPFDLNRPLDIKERFDLCISIEVAEHLPEDRAAGFVEDLCNLSDVVLFSAAIKHQKGRGHINTQWASYWVALFNACHYECYDVIRWRIWNDRNIDWWYRQNILLFVSESTNAISRQALQKDQRSIIDIVHPENYEHLCDLFGYPEKEP